MTRTKKQFEREKTWDQHKTAGNQPKRNCFGYPSAPDEIEYEQEIQDYDGIEYYLACR